MFCHSDNVDRELKYISSYLSHQSTALPPIQKSSVVPKNRHLRFGDTLPTILMAPLQSVLCASTAQPKVTPTNHHWNSGSITSLSSPFLQSSSRWSSKCQLLHLNLKCNLRLLKAWASETKLLPL